MIEARHMSVRPVPSKAMLVAGGVAQFGGMTGKEVYTLFGNTLGYQPIGDAVERAARQAWPLIDDGKAT